MNRTSASAIVLLSVLPAVAQPPAASDATAFALGLHRRIADSENVMTSPYSLRQALGMAYVGAAGETREEMARIMGAGPAFESEEKALRASLNEARGPITLKIANAMFVKDGYALLPRFLEKVRDSFAAEVFVRKFDPAAVSEINAWAGAQTNGKIPTILRELKADDRAVLLNAVYFKGDWETAFPRGERSRYSGGPRQEVFHPTKGDPFPLKLMSIDKGFDYAETPEWQAVRLPYEGDRLAMVVVLPAAESSLAAFRAKLEVPVWDLLRKKLARRSGLVAMPKFKFDRSYDMKSFLTALGMHRAFDKAGSDFSAMSKPRDIREELYISQVLQKTFVAVDEEGTEAAAVAMGMMTARGSARRDEEKPFRLIADRPFLFVIEDVRSGTILFIGEVHDPR